LDVLESKAAQAALKQIGYWEIYDWLANQMVAKGEVAPLV
jgi:hypothetical protein